MGDNPSYDTYAAYAASIGCPVLDYETWARIRHKLDKHENEAAKIRDRWLAKESDVKMLPPTRERNCAVRGAPDAHMKQRRNKLTPHSGPDKPPVPKLSRDEVLYNLLPGEREALREAQGGIDPITGDPLSPHAHVDHCHKTGLVRGLLNPLTNKFLVDNRERLLAMLAYIDNPPAPDALGEKVYGLLGKAKVKKVMKYGPAGSPKPCSRSSKLPSVFSCPSSPLIVHRPISGTVSTTRSYFAFNQPSTG